jgi:membrane-associated phospholipid phosphatase
VFRTGRDFPLIDSTLDAIDRALGFDWLAYVAWFNQRPWLTRTLGRAYASIFWQPFAVALILAYRQTRRLHCFIAAMVATVTIASGIALVLPCLGPYTFLKATPELHSSVELVTQQFHVPLLDWLRQAQLTFPPPPILGAGLISFPSYHAAVAYLCTWACWRSPVFRPIFLCLNALMLVATPVHGSHYLIDVLAGLLIAAVCAPLMEKLLGDPAAVRRDLPAGPREAQETAGKRPDQGDGC